MLLKASLIYSTGLRLQECMNLQIKDIDFETNVLTVKSEKGDKNRLTVKTMLAGCFCLMR